MRPSEALRNRLEAVRAAIARSPFENPRVFGSVARGEDDESSDLDLLVEPREGASLFDLARLELELADVMGIRVDVLTPASLGPRVAPSVYRDLRPL